MKSTLKLAALAVTTAALTAGVLGAGGVAQAATTPTLTVAPLQGQWQFGAGNPADAIALSVPGGTCATGSVSYIPALTQAGAEASVTSSGAPLATRTTLGTDLAVPAKSGAFTSGTVQLLVNTILPAGTSDIALSATDAAKPVGTVVATGTFSLVGACLNSSGLVSSFVTPVDVSAATRAPKPADWPTGAYYDNLQWSWDARATAQLALTVTPTTLHTWQPAVLSVKATAPTGVAPTGNVTIKDGSTVLTTLCLNNGKATGILPPLGSKGGHTITAVYQGSPDLKPGATALDTVTVDK